MYGRWDGPTLSPSNNYGSVPSRRYGSPTRQRRFSSNPEIRDQVSNNCRGIVNLESITKALSAIRSCPTQELDLHERIATSLEQAKIPFTREVVIPEGRLDFVVGKLILEVKTRGSALQVLRQVGRYLENPDYHGVIIITTRPMVLRMTMNGKPVHQIDLWRNFL